MWRLYKDTDWIACGGQLSLQAELSAPPIVTIDKIHLVYFMINDSQAESGLFGHVDFIASLICKAVAAQPKCSEGRI